MGHSNGLVSVAPFLGLLWSAAAFALARDTLVVIAGLQSASQVALILGLRARVNALFQVGCWYALAHPLAGAVFLGMMAGCYPALHTLLTGGPSPATIPRSGRSGTIPSKRKASWSQAKRHLG